MWAVVDDGAVLALMLPVEITIMPDFRKFSTRAVAYGSVLHKPGTTGEKALAKLLNCYCREVGGNVIFTELRNLYSLNGLQPILHEHGFFYEDHLNYLINLDCPGETTLHRFKKRTRKYIRSGLRSGVVTVKEVSDRKEVTVCYDLLHLTYRQACAPLADRSLFEAAFDVLYPKGMIRFTLAYADGVPVATSVELLYKRVVYAWYGGFDRRYRSFRPNEILMWNILEWSAANGFHTYDFGGAGKPGEAYGVRDFKGKFGGKLVSYGRNICVHSPMRLRISKLGYSLYRILCTTRKKMKGIG